MMPSVPNSSVAQGAVRARIDSATTLLLLLEPRPPGMTTTRPASTAPTWGWWASITVPVAGSTPPQ
jgi:hypothetical protein